MRRALRKRRQVGGLAWLLPGASAMLTYAAQETLIKLFAGIAVKYGLMQVARKLAGPHAPAWLHRILQFIPESFLAFFLTIEPGHERITGTIGLAALQYVNSYLSKYRQNADDDVIMREQDRIDQARARRDTEASNALMMRMEAAKASKAEVKEQKKEKTEKKEKKEKKAKAPPAKKEAKKKSTKSKAAKNDATVQD